MCRLRMIWPVFLGGALLGAWWLVTQEPPGGAAPAAAAAPLTQPTTQAATRCRDIVSAKYMTLIGLALLANESDRPPVPFRIGIRIPQFAEAGDEIWEVRSIASGPPSLAGVRAILWYNPKTEQVHPVAGSWQSPTGAASTRLGVRPTTQIAADFAQRARELAAAEYEWLTARKLMDDTMFGVETVREPVELKVGFEVNGFCRSGETLFEAVVELVRRDDHQLRGIFWVSPRTGQVYAVAGVWQRQ
jgi:hypothetical protein